MLSQTLCYWDKQQSADSNIFQFHLIHWNARKINLPSDSFLVSKLIFQHNDRGPTKFYAGPEQLLVCVVINNSRYPAVKNNNTASHAFGKYWTQARGLLNYRLKYCWPKAFYCISQQNDFEQEKCEENWGGSNMGAKQKSGGSMTHPGPPLESPLGDSCRRTTMQMMLIVDWRIHASAF